MRTKRQSNLEESKKVFIQFHENLYQADFPSDMRQVWWQFVKDEEKHRRACEIFSFEDEGQR